MSKMNWVKCRNDRKGYEPAFPERDKRQNSLSQHELATRDPMYVWNPKKAQGLSHISTGVGTLCKIENNGNVIKAFTAHSNNRPDSRPLCKICAERNGAPPQPSRSSHYHNTPPNRDGGVKCSW